MTLRLARDLRLSADATVLVVDLLEEIGAQSAPAPCRFDLTGARLLAVTVD